MASNLKIFRAGYAEMLKKPEHVYGRTMNKMSPTL